MVTKLAEAERVHVQTPNFSGMATVLYIAPGEIYPVQVELDQGDADGHKIQRVMFREIVNEPKTVEAAVSFEGPADPQLYIGEVLQDHQNYGYKGGQQFILGAVKYPGVYQGGPAKSFYLYNPEGMAFRGCMPVSMFKVIGPYDGQSVPKEPESVSIEQETGEITVEAAFIPEKVNYQQMSLLDFL